MQKTKEAHSSQLTASGFKGFISFEGIEGSGKTTQVRLLGDYLKAKGYDVLITEEPGGTEIGFRIREILLDPRSSMNPLTELLLYSASRAEHVREVIYPALMRGTIVIIDRFSDSTIAYQGYGRGIDLIIIKALDDIVAGDLKPYISFLLDIDASEGLRRNTDVRKEDRFELEAIEFHERIRHGYLQIAREEPNRVKVIDASGEIEEVNKKIIKVLETVWP